MTPKFEIARAVSNGIVSGVRIGDSCISSSDHTYAKSLAYAINKGLSGHVVLKSDYDKLKDAAGRMAEALRKAKEDIPRGFIDCHGDKCRQKNCWACLGEDHAQEYDISGIEQALTAYEDAVKDLEEK